MNVKRFNFIYLTTAACFIYSTSFVASTTCRAEKPKTQKQTMRRHSSKNVTAHRDLVYATIGEKDILLDLYIPKNTTVKPPLLVWIHGGGWQSGSKDSCPLYRETQRGYAVASLNYRLSHEAMFPAQIHDCKGAIRWLRANAEKFGYNSERIGVAGSSAGGQLVALLGTSGGVKELEGNVGGNLGQSSSV
jgi:acetyl esterase/lipase